MARVLVKGFGMVFKVGSVQLAVYAGLVLIGAGATYGVIHWPFGKAPAGSPSAESSLGGPVIAGVCVLSRQAVFDASAVGKAANEKYRALHDGFRLRKACVMMMAFAVGEAIRAA